MPRPIRWFALMVTLLGISTLCQGEEAKRQYVDKLVFQYAGNLGMISAGVGWGTSAHTELHLLAGYAPESVEGTDIYVVGAKGNYLFNPFIRNERLSLQLYGGLALLYYFGDRYTNDDYPPGYYTGPSSEWHFMPYLGLKLTSHEPAQRGVAVYSELGILDVHLLHYYNNYETLELQEAINLSVGITVPLR